MAFGTKVNNMKALKKTLQKGGGNNNWIKYIPKNGSMNARFIQEPEEWVNYVEHFDTTLRKSYPCSGEVSCPGCVAGERKSYRYLTNAVDRDNDRVIPLQLPKDLANRLVVKYEKWGTLVDRDIELTRSGEGLDTVYDLDAGIVDRAKIDKYTPLDLLKVLEDAFSDVFGGGLDEDDDEEDAKPKAAVKMRSKSKAVAALAEDDDDEDDVPEALKSPAEVEAKKPAAKKAAKKAAAPVAEPEFTPEEDDDEDDTPLALVDDDAPDADADDDEDDDEGYSQEQLEALPLGALRAVARDFGVETKGKAAPAIIAEIMASGE